MDEEEVFHKVLNHGELEVFLCLILSFLFRNEHVLKLNVGILGLGGMLSTILHSEF